MPIARSQLFRLFVPKKSKSDKGQTGKADSIQTVAGSNGKSGARRAPAARKRQAATKKPGDTKKKKMLPAGKAGGIAAPTDEEISIRAYFIAERRHRLALPGDASADWLEAKRELISERQPR